MILYYLQDSSWLAQRAITTDELACSAPPLLPDSMSLRCDDTTFIYPSLLLQRPIAHPIASSRYTRVASGRHLKVYPHHSSGVLSSFSPLTPNIKLRVVYLESSSGCELDKEARVYYLQYSRQTTQQSPRCRRK